MSGRTSSAQPSQRDGALRLWAEGCRAHAARRWDRAIRLYRQSIAIHPTGEAHTWLGRAYSMKGRLEDAIVECHRAIEVDPDLGNAYLDIGTYLISAGELDEAEPWFELAKAADRCESRHSSFLNLGRLFLAKGQTGRALEEFRGALRQTPGNEEAAAAIREILDRMV